MKKTIRYLALLVLVFAMGCSEQKKETATEIVETPLVNLPFTKLELKDMASFKPATDNWAIVGTALSDNSKQNTLTTTDGSGVLINTLDGETKEDLFTMVEHGDMELELDVMMAKGASTSLVFQGLYELRLKDSWGVTETDSEDMGGIGIPKSTSEHTTGSSGAPLTNAAKAPGLWQHLKVLFHAPRFDASGEKTKNAWFEKVWLNGILLQEQIELEGPTQNDATTEVPKAPLHLKGDTGAFAFKNIQYKLYEERSIALSNLSLREFDSPSWSLLNLDSLNALYTRATDSISPITVVAPRGRTILEYTGTMAIPVDGDYLFEMKVNGGAALLLEQDTVINLNGNYPLDTVRLAKVNLKKGAISFKLLYNKYAPWRRGLEFYVEGPEMQRYSIQEPRILVSDIIDTSPFVVTVADTPITQRSFWMHEGEKRTHTIAVGMPQGTHYVYDLQAGSLLQIWDGDFLDATQMWLARGEKQLGNPLGFVVALHGDSEFAPLDNDDAIWPDYLTDNKEYRQLGYEFDEDGIPSFMNQTGGTKVTNTFMPKANQRGMKRMISVDGDRPIWHKIAEGEAIEKLPDGTFIVNHESYFVDFSKSDGLKLIIRNSGGKDELIVEIPSGKQQIEYSIIW